MSYNPAFEFDEAALDGSSTPQNASATRRSAVKLTAFKQLSVDDDLQCNAVDDSKQRSQLQQAQHNSQQFASQQASTRQTLIELANAAASQNVAIAAAAAALAKQRINNSNGNGNNSQLVSLTSSSAASTTTNTAHSSSTGSPSPSASLNFARKLQLQQHQQPFTTAAAAVECRDLMYDVGRGKSHKTILHNINVTVPEGSIYGLLGPSGCGKTTLLRCIIGRVKPRAGQVRVFGYKPNESGSQIPGAAIGYMPQEISVYDDFTINETLTYFGKINRMKGDLISARIGFLINFLDLPGKHRLVGSLSGGQKRRVSLAAALVHSPPLLILDEPTVGVDPLLRQSIWKHLVTLAQSEKITVLITTHYIEEARQANVVGLMRHGKLLAEESPDNLMAQHSLDSLEEVFLKLCITDSSRRAARLVGLELNSAISAGPTPELLLRPTSKHAALLDEHGSPIIHSKTGRLLAGGKMNASPLQTVFSIEQATTNANENLAVSTTNDNSNALSVVVSNNDNVNQDILTTSVDANNIKQHNTLTKRAIHHHHHLSKQQQQQLSTSNTNNKQDVDEDDDDLNMHNVDGDESSLTEFVVNKHNLRSMVPGTKYAPKKVSPAAWLMSLLAVTWKNYIRLKRNYSVLLFEFILPAVQVILFCLCIGGDPFDVPLAVVNDEVIPQASRFFLDSIDKNTIRQVPFTNLSDAIESVRRGETWGAIHIPDRYTQFLQERLTHPADITNETLANGTINIYPDLTNLHLALAMENTFREAFVKFAKDTLNMFGYDPASAELPIRVEKPVYGTLAHNGYLEFMAPGVVISITYVMATGLTALAFILEKRDGLLERSLVSGVTTSQILLAHAAVQVIVMTIQIALVLAFTFFVFQIPSNGPFVWVVLLILLQGCTGMGFGLLVSALCEEENTAVMMLVGTFYTNLILAGIIWPLEAMPHWIRWLSYIQPQTLPTEALRNILSRGWGIGDSGVYLGFVVTIGWLVVFLLAAGIAMRYSK